VKLAKLGDVNNPAPTTPKWVECYYNVDVQPTSGLCLWWCHYPPSCASLTGGYSH